MQSLAQERTASSSSGGRSRLSSSSSETMALLLAAASTVGSACRGSRCLRRSSPLYPGEKTLGIDLGTTNSAMASFEAAQPTIIPNAEGERVTPSVVAFTKDGELLVGSKAKRQAALNPESTFSSLKRFMGLSMSEAKSKQQLVSYQVKASPEGAARFVCPHVDRLLAPEELSAHVLRKLRLDACKFLKSDIQKAVITVPAYFNDAQRSATKAAALLAGFEVLRVCSEPTMAALAYGLVERADSWLLILDLGGGTFDVSLLQTGAGFCEVMTQRGLSNVGGDNFDDRIVEWLLQSFQEKEAIDLREDPHALQRLREAAEKAKMELSELSQARISVPFVAVTADGPKNVDEVLTRQHFEDMTRDLIERCRRPIMEVFQEAAVPVSIITEAVLVGGSSRMPAFQNLVKEILGRKPVNKVFNPEEAVALGASIQAAMICGEVKNIMLLDVTPLSLGVETEGGVFWRLLERGTTIPYKVTKFFTTSEDGQDEVEVRIYQGERPLAKDNKLIGKLKLQDIPPARKGIARIEVNFTIDVEGILTVRARDAATMQSQRITISDCHGLTDQEVKDCFKEAEKYWDKDERECEELDLRTAAIEFIDRRQRLLPILGPRIPTENEKEIREQTLVLEALVLDKQPHQIDYDHLKDAVQDTRLKWIMAANRMYGKQLIDGKPGPGYRRKDGGAAGGGSGSFGDAWMSGMLKTDVKVTAQTTELERELRAMKEMRFNAMRASQIKKRKLELMKEDMRKAKLWDD